MKDEVSSFSVKRTLENRVKLPFVAEYHLSKYIVKIPKSIYI